MSAAVELSVVVVNWNGGEGLLRCLEAAIAALEGRRCELWLVDNASHDGSAEGAAARFPEARLLRNSRNLGFARAANQALSRSAGQCTLLLNPDVVLTREALDKLLAALASDPRIGIVGGPSVDRAGQPAPGFEPSYPGARRREVTGAHGSLCRDVAWVSAACLLARREMIAEVGLLDEGFFMYYEDVDWCFRARQAGWRVVWVPEAVVAHELGGSARLVPAAETARRAAASRLHFWRKYYGQARALGLRAGMAGSAALGALWRLGPAVLSRAARERVGCELARLGVALSGPAREETQI